MDLYLRLIIKNIFSHKRKGKSLFLLITLCIIAAIITSSVKSSFFRQYINQSIDTYSGHLTIVSCKNYKVNVHGYETDNIHLIKINKDFIDYINDLEFVEIGAPIISMEGTFHTFQGDFQGGGPIIGIDPKKISGLYPGLFFVTKNREFKYKPGLSNIPVLRKKDEKFERQVEGNTIFRRHDFKLTDSEFEDFKETIASNFSQFFQSIDVRWKAGTKRFIEKMNELLQETDLYTFIPNSFLEEYNYEIDDVIYELKNLKNDSNQELAKWNKRLFHVLYPESIHPVPDSISLNVKNTLMLSVAKNIKKDILPVVLPITYVGFVKAIPLFHYPSFLDISILKDYLELGNDEYTDFIIRLKNEKYLAKAKEVIGNYLKENHLPYTIIDYKQMGSKYFPIALAFKIVLTFLEILFIIIISIYIFNSVLTTIIKRKSEIGSSITIGMSKNENIIVIIGEIFFLVLFSWFCGAIIASFLIFFFGKIGLPGFVFFNSKRLFLLYDIRQLFFTLIIILPVSTIAAFIPSLKILNLEVVESLRER